MKYIRFGEIPKNGKSVNFLKMNGNEREDFTYWIRTGNIECAYESISEDKFEKGLSVFELGSDGMPVLENLKMISSLAIRTGENAYIVEGERVGTGNDGEPLVEVEKVEKVELDQKELRNHIIETLKRNFEKAEYKRNDEAEYSGVYKFYNEYKVNKKTGEKVLWLEKTNWKEYELLSEYEYVYGEWSFRNPKNGFDTKLGL